MRYILGIDTASPDGSVALLDGHAVLVEPLLPREHSSGLSLAVERLLAARSIGVADLAGVAVSEGPGSFTGLRIGLAWAKGLALGRDLPLVLVSSHAAGARAAHGPAGWIATVLPSERGFVEAALWDGSGEGPAWGPEKMESDEAIPTLMAEARRRTSRGAPPESGASVELRPSTSVLAAALEEDAAEFGLTVRAPGPLAGAVAEIGARLLASGARADLVLAAPAYGREPNARKPTA
jgi:tRNA threonylcarbamoyladenosine biosynthesis protein TsaB